MSVRGDSDAAGAASSSAREFVRRLLLKHVPARKEEAGTAALIASRSEMQVYAVRAHLACMVADVLTVTRFGRVRYYRRPEDDMAHDHDQTPLPERITDLLGRRDIGSTAIQIGGALSVRPNTVTAELKTLVSDNLVVRTGEGKRGDPYMYHQGVGSSPSYTDSPEVVAAKVESELALERKDQKTIDDPFGVYGKDSPETAESEAPTSPLTAELPAADTEAPAEPGLLAQIAAAELRESYGAVIDDVTKRAAARADDAHGLLDDAKVLTAAATLLMRILEGEDDR